MPVIRKVRTVMVESPLTSPCLDSDRLPGSALFNLFCPVTHAYYKQMELFPFYGNCSAKKIYTN